jgi:hypothetical protein
LPEISENICKVAQFDDMIAYESLCSCGSDSHMQTLSIEYDKEFGCPTLTLNTRVFSTNLVDWYTKDAYNEALESGNYYAIVKSKALYFLQAVKARVKMTYQIWVKGYVEAQGEFIFRGDGAMKDYVKAIEQAREAVSANRGTK